MNTNAECIPCIFSQALRIAKKISDDPADNLDYMVQLAKWLGEADFKNNPSVLSQPAYELANKLTNNRDLFLEEKKQSNKIALSVKPTLRKIIDSSDDPLDTALHAAAAGNTIDLGVGHKFDIEKDIIEMVNTGFAVNDIDSFRAELKPGRKLLYLGDNAGEIVFDTLLIEEIIKTGIEIVFSVKSGFIINDATMEDAKAVGMTDLTEVMETGGTDIGVNWDNISDEFRNLFETADVIISKGHGNYETTMHRKENIYFLLKAKCDYVAGTLGVTKGDIVFKKNSH